MAKASKSTVIVSICFLLGILWSGNGAESATVGHCNSCFCLRQAKYEKVNGIHVNNQFGPEVLDALKDEELCVPSIKILAEGAAP